MAKRGPERPLVKAQVTRHHKMHQEIAQKLDGLARIPGKALALAINACKHLRKDQLEKELLWQLRLHSHAAWRKKVSAARNAALHEIMRALRLR